MPTAKTKYRVLQIQLMQPQVAFDMPPEPTPPTPPDAPSSVNPSGEDKPVSSPPLTTPTNPPVADEPISPPPVPTPPPISSPSISPQSSTSSTSPAFVTSPSVTMVTEPVDQTSSFSPPPPEKKSHRKTLLLVLVTIFIALTIPLVVWLSQNSQDIRQRAHVLENITTNDINYSYTVSSADQLECNTHVQAGGGVYPGKIYVASYYCDNVTVGGCNENGFNTWNVAVGQSFQFQHRDKTCGSRQIDIGCTDAGNQGTYGTVRTINYPSSGGTSCITTAPSPSPSPSASPGLGDCGASCSDNSQCQIDLQCTTWDPNPVCWGARCGGSNPSPSPSPSPAAQCQNVKLYSVTGDINVAGNWHLLTATELTQLTASNTIYVTTQGTGVSGGTISRARIRVSKGNANPPPFTPADETTNIKPKTLPADPNEYYIQYTLSSPLPTPPTFTFGAEVCVLNPGGVCQWF